MKLTRELKWLWPYLESVEHLVPLSVLKGISCSSRKPPNRLDYHAITYQKKKDHYTIVFPVGKQELDLLRTTPIDENTQRHFLYYLAHELAHLVHWDHSEAHLALEAAVYYKFSNVLCALGFEEKRNRV